MRQQSIDDIEHGIVARPRLLREIAATLRTTEQWLLWKEGPENAPQQPPDVAQIPLLSWVSAGRLTDAESQIPVEDVPLLAFADLGRGEFFALKVQGDSMDRISPDGSTIVVNRADRQLVPDKPYVFWHRSEGATFKLWQPEPARLEPHSWNAANKPIFIKRKSDFEVIGRVRRSVLDLS
jgi:SOS-response transcriptional repressor LexA